MKCRGANFVALLLILTANFVDFINSACIVNKYPYPNEFWYNCVGSSNYVADVKRAPIDVPHVSFSMSIIPIINNGVFSRFAQNLTILEVVASTVKEIESNAFQGLLKLLELDLAGNELEIVKEAWFEGLTNLETIVLSHNKIRHIEDGFFSTVSPLKQLFIDSNKLTCISDSVLSELDVKRIQYELNPLSWKCRHDIAIWLEGNMRVRFDRYHYDNWFSAKNVTKTCLEQSAEYELTDKFINDCVNATLLQWLPKAENDTAMRICEVQDNPSPFLSCEFDSEIKDL